MTYKLFADTNIYLDLLLQRGKEWKSAEAIFRMAEQGALEVYTSASSLLNIMYIMRTYKLPIKEVTSYTQMILNYTELVNPDNKTFAAALESGFRDMEDAVQYFTALQIKGISYFITSNIKDYKNVSRQLQVIAPHQFMDIYK